MTWEKDLNTFLAERFSTEDLTSFCYYNLPPVHPHLRGTSISDLASSLLEHANRRGLLNKPFFDALADERPNFVTRIRALQGACPTGHATPPPPAHAPAPTPRAPVPLADDSPSQAALVLDRTDQWKRLRQHCADDDRHLIIFVHGDHEQDVDLFLQRIKTYFKEECTRRHNLRSVLRTREHSTAISAEDWAQNIIHASPLRAPLADALASAARALDALYILEDYGHPLKRLTWPDFEGLIDLFQKLIRAAVEEVPPTRPLRFVVPLQHDPQEAKATRKYLTDTTRALAPLPGFTTILLKELALPTAKDFARFAEDLLGSLSSSEKADLAALYKDLTDRRKHPRQSYRTLGDALQDFCDRTGRARAAARRP